MSNLELLVSGLDFGEGPRWREGRLWYSDFYHHRVYAISPDGEQEVIVDLGEEQPSGLGWLPDDSLLIVAMIAQKVLKWDGETLSDHADLSHIATGLCNDMVVNSDGVAYVGNFGWDIEDEFAEQRGAALTIVRPDGTVEVGAEELLFPNGSVITPDGSTLMVGETFGGRFTAFDINGDGSLSNQRIWAEVHGTFPDGCTMDADFGIWFSDAFGGGVFRTIEGGEITDHIETESPSYACMLGGNDNKTLHIITAPEAGSGRAGTGDGSIWTIRVDIPHAGRP